MLSCSFFLSGVQDGVLEEVPITTNVDNWNGHIGVADSSPYTGHIGVADSSPYNNYRMEGHVDEFKYFYRVLNSAGKY